MAKVRTLLVVHFGFSFEARAPIENEDMCIKSMLKVLFLVEKILGVYSILHGINI